MGTAVLRVDADKHGVAFIQLDHNIIREFAMPSFCLLLYISSSVEDRMLVSCFRLLYWLKQLFFVTYNFIRKMAGAEPLN